MPQKCRFYFSGLCAFLLENPDKVEENRVWVFVMAPHQSSTLGLCAHTQSLIVPSKHVVWDSHPGQHTAYVPSGATNETVAVWTLNGVDVEILPNGSSQPSNELSIEPTFFGKVPSLDRACGAGKVRDTCFAPVPPTDHLIGARLRLDQGKIASGATTSDSWLFLPVIGNPYYQTLSNLVRYELPTSRNETEYVAIRWSPYGSNDSREIRVKANARVTFSNHCDTTRSIVGRDFLAYYNLLEHWLPPSLRPIPYRWGDAGNVSIGASGYKPATPDSSACPPGRGHI